MRRLILALLLCMPAVAIADPAKVGGKVAPDGKTEIQIDLPHEFQKANISSAGLGCCVFRSTEWAARFLGLSQFYDFPEWMVKNHIPGGGYPSKLDDLIKRICKDRNMAVPDYIQIESNDLEIIKLALKTGRPVCNTYGKSPSGRYGNKPIQHMVCTFHATDDYFVVADNNFPGTYEWMTPQEYLAAYKYGAKTGWCVIFLSPSPPPIPHN